MGTTTIGLHKNHDGMKRQKSGYNITMQAPAFSTGVLMTDLDPQIMWFAALHCYLFCYLPAFMVVHGHEQKMAAGAYLITN